MIEPGEEVVDQRAGLRELLLAHHRSIHDDEAVTREACELFLAENDGIVCPAGREAASSALARPSHAAHNRRTTTHRVRPEP